MTARERLIAALDVDTKEKALDLADALKADVKLFKIGFELFSSAGPDIVREIREKGLGVFLDLKFHDIPNTVAKAASAVTRLGVSIFNVHALGGLEMMKQAASAARDEAKRLGAAAPKIIAVTILTSADENGLKKVGINDNMKSQVLRLALLAKEAGLDGVVASPQEARFIREKTGKGFVIITPGVRPQGAERGDQKRIATPREAIASGADYIVVGRPIIEAKDPAGAAREIIKEIES